ncbi:AAA domain-containing protein [Vibrio harveyi]|uniref:AAA domain-containing protein n=1 Tax=Vibrio harveyi TaxID=669 RepID=UPI003BB569FE
MKIELWDGGLLEHEVSAIERIEKHFCAGKKSKKIDTKGSMKEQLGALKNDGMFPWKGYAGFRFVDKGKEGEFDLVVITHCKVLIIELKHWNNGVITCKGDRWYKNDQDMGRSPVSVTRNKKFLMENKLKKFRGKFTNEGRLPFVDFLVVMTGNADFSQLKGEQKEHTISLNDFLNFKNEHAFNKRFRPHPDSKTLNSDFPIFDELFDRTNTENKTIYSNGYKAVGEIFDHPKGVYKEYLSVSEASNKDEALLRLWNFGNIPGRKAKTPEGRFEIVSREREVLGYIKHQDYELYKYCLNSLTSVHKDQITSQFIELYELPPSHIRFNEFIGRFGESLPDQDRYNLVKMLVAKFADLHEIRLAHRDLGDHSIWISPSKEVALSSFISAYHQPKGTVGDYRDILSANNGIAPFGMNVTDKTTPYQIDVYALSIMAWHVLKAERISPNSLKTIEERISDSSDWYSCVLEQAVKQPFSSAKEFFDALKESEPKADLNLDFDLSSLEPYKRSIKLARQYPEDDLLSEDDEKEIYRSNGLLVKSWLHVNPSDNDLLLGSKTLSFLERLSKLKTLSPPYLPQIHDFGLATKSDCLYVVMDEVESTPWNKLDKGVHRLELVTKLLSVIEHLHGLHIPHGDLHPENVLVDKQEGNIFLIDIPDFQLDGDEPKNHRYSPPNIDACSAFERDNYAVMKMGMEILGLEFGEQNSELSPVSDAVLAEINDIEFGFKSLERFKSSLVDDLSPQDEFIEIAHRDLTEDLLIYPDNGKLYVDLEKSRKNPHQAMVTFHGVGGSLSFFYSPFEKRVTGVLKPRLRSSVGKKIIDAAKLELPFGLKVRSSRLNDSNQLSDSLRENDDFQRAVNFTISQDEDENTEAEAISLVDADKEVVATEEQQQIVIPTTKLWRSILETETESHPFAELSAQPEKVKQHPDQIILHHRSETDPLASFKKGDVIEALIIDKDDREFVLGEVLLKLSTLHEVRMNKLKARAFKLDEDDIVFFRSRQDKASYVKRRSALERILSKESTVSELINYFEPDCSLQAVEYGIEVDDEDYARYDRKDAHGNKIKLNDQQRAAFQRLIDTGPVSLLQGPPGTGKTEFIAAFVHFLIEKQNVNNILLVSQSHEAVNTAAERIRSHCQRLKTPLEVVRFSNREGAVSDGLKDVYSQSLINEKRELFASEAAYRTSALSKGLGLQKGYIEEVTLLELKLFKKIDELISISEELQRKKLSDKDKNGLKKAHKQLEGNVSEILLDKYELKLADHDIDEVKGLIRQKLDRNYAIRPDEAKRAQALAKISSDMLDVLATDSVNYDEFFARSRQLVTGTCVGIGQFHIGVSGNQYDWVIIDEAARSIASELAIAMQSGKRILLVGDHKQLPPLYSEPHKKALARKLGIVSDDMDVDELLQSDFARVFESEYGKQTGAQLLTQYRMARPIGNLVSSCFYDGELETGERKIPDVYKHAPNLLKSYVTWLDTSSLGKRSYHQDDRGTSIYNREEADQIINLLKSIADNDRFVQELKKTVKEGEPAIGVICMYGEQSRLIRRKFKDLPWEDDFKSMVKIDTVDSYQGKENRIVILSITRSISNLSTGFLRSPNRINVALSRAMDRLVVVGASEMWQGKNQTKPLGKVFDYIHRGKNQEDYRIINVKPNNRRSKR